MSFPGPPANWSGQWSVPVHPGYPPNYGPPPMPSNYGYGERAWNNGSWRFVPNNAAAKAGWAGPGPDARAAADMAAWNAYGKPYNPWGGKPPPRAPDEDYFRTKLSDNGLGLSGMEVK